MANQRRRVVAMSLVGSLMAGSASGQSRKAAPANSAHPPAPPVAPAAPDPAAIPPDVVMFNNGGLLRGTISELVPDDTVTILTLTGTTRRISMTEVTYAGPAAQAPQPGEKVEPEPAKPKRPSPKVQTPHSSYSGSADQVPISFVSPEGEELTLYIKTQGFTRVCTAPCDSILPAGAQQLALGLGTQRPVALPELTHLDGPSTLRGSYESHKGARSAGWTIFGVSLGLGSVLVLAGTVAKANDCTTASCTSSVPAFVYVAGLVGTIGSLFGLGMALNFDDANLRVIAQ